MKYNIVGVDGNAFSIMGYVINAMKSEGFSSKAIDDYKHEAMSSDYNHLIAISYDTIEKCNDHYNEIHHNEDYDIEDDYDEYD